MGIKKLYNDNLRKLPNEYGDVSVMYWKNLIPERVVLQELREELAPVLKVLFEQPLHNGTVPSDWDSANVLPLLKKGDKSSAAD